ncbi:MAG TPA: sulfatase-like hydrolase/transferase [Vicinamibacteria bacterium]
MSNKKERARPVPPRAGVPPPARRGHRTAAYVAGGLLVAGLAVALAAGAGRRARPVGGERPIDLLLISVDTLRADALGAYGSAAAQTPWMDRLAAGGVRFETAHAHNVVTLPSHANLLSGRYPLEHGVRDNSGFRFPAGTPTLATILKARGYRTGAFVSAFPLDSRFGLDAGFDVYDDRLGGAETQTGFQVAERAGARAVEAAVRWLGEQPGAPRFCFVHLYEPHFPYTPPPPFAERFAARPYDGEVAAADAALEPLLRPLIEAGNGRTLVVLTSDHGEGLGDHGELTHGVFAYEAMLRVPLILYAPRALPAAVVTSPARHVDVLPTVLDLLGLDAPAGLPGRSLRAAIAGGGGEAPPAYFEALSSSLNRGWAPLAGVVQDRWKYIELPLPELYDLGADPGERTNLAATHAAEAGRLRALLASLRAQDRGAAPAAESSETREKLRALGYLASSAAPRRERYGPADDPKRLIALDDLSSRMITLHAQGDVEGALALGRKVLAERPNDPLTCLQVAYLERARGDLPGAIAAARRALALRPTDAETAALLGVYLNEAGRPRETLDVLAPFAAAEPPHLDVLTAQGMALAALGRGAEALAVFARAARVDPSNAMARVNAGTVHLMKGDLAAARAELGAALALDPDLARAHNSLGVIAAREGRTADAIGHWKRAVALDPRDYQTLYNLGSVLRRAGRTDEARPYLEAYLRAAPRREAPDVAKVRAWLSARAGGTP